MRRLLHFHWFFFNSPLISRVYVVALISYKVVQLQSRGEAGVALEIDRDAVGKADVVAVVKADVVAVVKTDVTVGKANGVY